MKYVIWSTIDEPYTGSPLDHPAIVNGFCSKEKYLEQKGILLEVAPTKIEVEFEAASEEEANNYANNYFDTQFYSQNEIHCEICKAQGCEICYPKDPQ